MTELEIGGFATAWRLKKMLRWIREAPLYGAPSDASPTSPVMP
ncbi:hypothetical protein DFAR_2550003 [Desulfarculales bacterium]